MLYWGQGSFSLEGTGTVKSSETPESDLRIRAAVVILRAGGVIAFPTDTLYGLGADAFNVEAIERVFTAKGRDREHGLPVLIADATQIRQVAVNVSKAADHLATKFWPGALTLVLKRSPDLPAIVSGGVPTVAVRVPNHPIPVRIIRTLGNPIVGTSANRAGSEDSTTIAEVEDRIGPWLDYVFEDDSFEPQGEPSTIVDMTTRRPRVLREGAVTSEEIFQALEELKTEDPRDEPERVR